MFLLCFSIWSFLSLTSYLISGQVFNKLRNNSSYFYTSAILLLYVEIWAKVFDNKNLEKGEIIHHLPNSCSSLLMNVLSNITLMKNSKIMYSRNILLDTYHFISWSEVHIMSLTSDIPNHFSPSVGRNNMKLISQNSFLLLCRCSIFFCNSCGMPISWK